MKEMTVTELKKQLSSMDNKQLIKLLCQVYKNSDAAKKLLNITISGNIYEDQLLKQYKEKIYQQFFNTKGLYLSKAKAAITEFKKIGGSDIHVIDLQLYYVECGTEFTLEYGDIDERFYDSLCSMYSTVVRAVSKQKTDDIYQIFAERLHQIVEATQGMGWGYHDYLCDKYFTIPWLEENDG